MGAELLQVLGSEGLDKHAVNFAYCELEPCGPASRNCAQYLINTFPNLKNTGAIAYDFAWNATVKQTRLLKSAIYRMFKR